MAVSRDSESAPRSRARRDHDHPPPPPPDHQSRPSESLQVGPGLCPLTVQSSPLVPLLRSSAQFSPHSTPPSPSGLGPHPCTETASHAWLCCPVIGWCVGGHGGLDCIWNLGTVVYHGKYPIVIIMNMEMPMTSRIYDIVDLMLQ